jgi:hypothetical protein
MPHISVGTLIDTFSVLGALFAIWKGGTAERAAALAVIVNVVIGQTGQLLAPDSGGLIRLVNDGLTALVLLGVTLRYGAPWMGGVMLFYAAQFSLHSYYLVTGRPDDDFLHALINNIDYSGIIWCLIIGTAVAWRARLRRVRAVTA